MENNDIELKTHYSFSDFLFYICLLSVPFVTAAIVILKNSIWWMVIFAVISVGCTLLILRFYCSHCPHYTREGKILKCIFFWGLPKFFKKRPGKLNFTDKMITFSATIVLLIFPLYWLQLELGLLIIYILSLIGLGAAIFRNECDRCIYFECPMNKVSETIQNP
jgi:hypothetical protein